MSPNGGGDDVDGPVLADDYLLQPLLQRELPPLLHVELLSRLLKLRPGLSQERLDPRVSGVVERRAAVVVGPEGICARVEQQPHDVAVVGEDGVVERGAAAEVGAQVQLVAELLFPPSPFLSPNSISSGVSSLE